MKDYAPKIPDSVAKAMAEADKIQRSIPPEVLKLNETLQNIPPEVLELNEMLQSIPPEVFEMDELTKSQISPALSEFENIMSKQFNSLPSSKIIELKDEYETELLPAVDLVKTTDIKSATDEELVSICDKIKDHIINFAQSAGEKIKITTDKILTTLTSPQTNPQKCIYILFSILMSIIGSYIANRIP